MGIGFTVASVAMLAIASAPPPMQGSYRYTFHGGQNAGGDQMAVDYGLALMGECRLKASGYQTDEVIACTTRPAANGVAVLFKSYGDGRLVNAYGTVIYKPGQELFRITKRGRDVVTAWSGMSLPDDRRPVPGRYFKRERCTQ